MTSLSYGLNVRPWSGNHVPIMAQLTRIFLIILTCLACEIRFTCSQIFLPSWNSSVPLNSLPRFNNGRTRFENRPFESDGFSSNFEPNRRTASNFRSLESPSFNRNSNDRRAEDSQNGNEDGIPPRPRWTKPSPFWNNGQGNSFPRKTLFSPWTPNPLPQTTAVWWRGRPESWILSRATVKPTDPPSLTQIDNQEEHSTDQNSNSNIPGILPIQDNKNVESLSSDTPDSMPLTTLSQEILLQDQQGFSNSQLFLPSSQTSEYSTKQSLLESPEVSGFITNITMNSSFLNVSGKSDLSKISDSEINSMMASGSNNNPRIKNKVLWQKLNSPQEVNTQNDSPEILQDLSGSGLTDPDKDNGNKKNRVIWVKLTTDSSHIFSWLTPETTSEISLQDIITDAPSVTKPHRRKTKIIAKSTIPAKITEFSTQQTPQEGLKSNSEKVSEIITEKESITEPTSKRPTTTEKPTTEKQTTTEKPTTERQTKPTTKKQTTEKITTEKQTTTEKPTTESTTIKTTTTEPTTTTTITTTVSSTMKTVSTTKKPVTKTSTTTTTEASTTTTSTLSPTTSTQSTTTTLATTTSTTTLPPTTTTQTTSTSTAKTTTAALLSSNINSTKEPTYNRSENIPTNTGILKDLVDHKNSSDVISPNESYINSSNIKNNDNATQIVKLNKDTSDNLNFSYMSGNNTNKTTGMDIDDTFVNTSLSQFNIKISTNDSHNLTMSGENQTSIEKQNKLGIITNETSFKNITNATLVSENISSIFNNRSGRIIASNKNINNIETSVIQNINEKLKIDTDKKTNSTPTDTKISPKISLLPNLNQLPFTIPSGASVLLHETSSTHFKPVTKRISTTSAIQSITTSPKLANHTNSNHGLLDLEYYFTSSTPNPDAILWKSSFKIIDGIDWNANMADKKSFEYKSLERSLVFLLDDLFKNKLATGNYEGVAVQSFRKGSIIVDYNLYLKPEKSIKATHLEEEFKDYLMDHNGKLGNYSIEYQQITFEELGKPHLSSDNNYNVQTAGSSATLLPQWAVATIVIGCSTVIFIIIFVAVMSYHKGRNRRRFGKRLQDMESVSKSWEKISASNDIQHDGLYSMDDVFEQGATNPGRKKRLVAIQNKEMSLDPRLREIRERERLREMKEKELYRARMLKDPRMQIPHHAGYYNKAAQRDVKSGWDAYM